MDKTTADIVVTRVVEATQQRAWRAWVDPQDVRRWWGPDGFTAPVARMDVREGASSLVAMRAPDGRDLYNTWTYTVVRPCERLEFAMSFADEEGRLIPAAVAGLPADIPQPVHHVVTLESAGEGRTRVTVVEHGYEPGPIRDMSLQGQEQVMDKYARVVSQDGPGFT